VTFLKHSVYDATDINGWIDPQWRIEQDVIEEMFEQLSTSGKLHQVACEWQEGIQHVICDVLPRRLHTTHNNIGDISEQSHWLTAALDWVDSVPSGCNSWPVSARHGSSVPHWTVYACLCVSKASWWASVLHNQRSGHTTLQTVNLRRTSPTASVVLPTLMVVAISVRPTRTCWLSRRRAFNTWRSLVPSGCVKSVERPACVCQSCDVTCVFSQGAEDRSFLEELWLTSACWTPTTVWTFLNWHRTRRVCVTFRYWL